MSDVKKIGSAGIPLNIVDANGRKIMGDAYDNTAIYAVGDYCISGDHAYKCITEIETPEDFNTNHWQQITIEEILKEHDTLIESVNSSLTQKSIVIHTTTPTTTGSSVNVYQDATLLGHYMITGYSILINGVMQHWVYNNVVSNFGIDATGIFMNITNAVVADKDIYFSLDKID